MPPGRGSINAVPALILYGLLAIVVAAVLFALAVRFLPAGEQIAPPLRDEPPWELPPDRRLRPEDVDTLRLPVALRGYRFAETDELLDRLSAELQARDEEIARLHQHAADTADTVPARSESADYKPDALVVVPAADEPAAPAGGATTEPAGHPPAEPADGRS